MDSDTRLVMNNLLGRSSADERPVMFTGGETIRDHVTKLALLGFVGDLLILCSVNKLQHTEETIAQTNWDRERRAEELADKLGHSDEIDRADGEYLDLLRKFGIPPPLTRQPGESEEVFLLKQLARKEFLSGDDPIVSDGNLF